MMKEFSFKKTVSNKLCSLNQYFSSLEITRPIINTQLFKSLNLSLGSFIVRSLFYCVSHNK